MMNRVCAVLLSITTVVHSLMQEILFPRYKECDTSVIQSYPTHVLCSMIFG